MQVINVKDCHYYYLLSGETLSVSISYCLIHHSDVLNDNLVFETKFITLQNIILTLSRKYCQCEQIGCLKNLTQRFITTKSKGRRKKNKSVSIRSVCYDLNQNTGHQAFLKYVIRPTLTFIQCS